MHTIIHAQGVIYELPSGRSLLRNLNFSLARNLTALVGPNGIGKTTLARLLAGEIEPSSGQIQRMGAITYLSQREPPPPLTVGEYLSDFDWSALGTRLLGEIRLESPCDVLSGGEWMRVRIARALTGAYLILDEPSNDLDRSARELLLEFLRSYDGGVLLISHDREALALCQEVLELSSQGLARYGDGWSGYEKARTQERARLEAQLENARRERESARAQHHERVEAQARRSRQGAAKAARGGIPRIVAGALKRRAQATSGRVHSETVARADDAAREAFEAFAALKSDPIMYADLTGREIPTQKLVAEAQGFNIRLGRWIFAQDLEFTWRGPIRLALRGANGAGKSTLLRAILGSEFEIRGELRTGDLNLLYLDQRTAFLDDQKSIFENVREVSRADESEIRGGLAKFLFHGDSVFQQVGTLSGGERLRAALARGLMATEKPELLILDEPTNNLDLANVEFLEHLTREFRGALIVVSHDEVFLKNCELSDEFRV